MKSWNTLLFAGILPGQGVLLLVAITLNPHKLLVYSKFTSLRTVLHFKLHT